MLCVLSAPVIADVLTPADFLKLWESDNKRNLLLRYQDNERDPGLYLQGDLGPKVDVATDLGVNKGEIDRATLNLNAKYFNFYYDYMFLYKLNAETEYGELVFGLSTADLFDFMQIDIAAKKNSLPSTTLDGSGNEVFKHNTSSSQQNENLGSEFDQKILHIDIYGVDISALIDKDSKYDSLALQLPPIKLGKHAFTLGVLNYKENLIAGTQAKQELMFNYELEKKTSVLDAELGYIRFKQSGDSQISRFGLGYERVKPQGNWYSKLYITDDLADSKTYLGYRLGMKIGNPQQGGYYIVNISRNALSEIDSMVIRDINIISFAMVAPLKM